MRQIHGVVHHYAWGDTRAIPHLLGREVDGRPWAEWWLGTHPGGPARMEDGHALTAVAGELPYMLKVLAAAEPLSLQTHPDAATALAGFEREHAAGLRVDDPARIYKDRSAKPELLCALTPFDALCGFRPVADTLTLLDWLGAHSLAHAVRHDGLPATVAAIYRGEIDTGEVLHVCANHSNEEAQLVTGLAEQYPGDPSAVVTLLLNRVLLQPGEAIYLDAGNLHAYLKGTGVEVMGASDNVVRGGMTRKHVDVEELLRVARIEPLADPVVRPIDEGEGRWRYPTPGAPFELWRIDVASEASLTAEARELLICTDGDANAIRRGQALYLAPGDQVTLEGPSTLFRVTEPRR